MEPTNDEAKISERLDQLEERLLEQEHRPVAAIRNLICVLPTLPKGDKRRRAIIFSVFWALFFSPGGVAVAGSAVAIVTVALLAWQNYLIFDSNQLLLTQIQAEERVALQSQRLESIRDLYGEEPAALRSEALLTLTTITTRLLELVPDSTHLVRRDLRGANLENCVLDYKEVENFDFTGARFSNASIASGVFEHCTFAEVTLDGAKLASAFKHSNFDQVNFADVDVNQTEFDNCSFVGADFSMLDPSGAVFKGCYFKDCKIPASSAFYLEANLDEHCVFTQIQTLNDQEKSDLKTRTGAKIAEEEDWQ